MRSFRLALAIRTGASVLALFVLVALASVAALRSILFRQLDKTLLHLAEVEAQAGAARTGPEFEFHEGVLLSSQNGAGAELTRYAQLWSSEGEPLVRSRNLDRDLTLPPGAIAAAQAGQVRWDTHVWEGRRLRCIIYPLRLVGAAHGVHVLQVAAPLEPLDRTVTEFALLAGLTTLIAAGAAFFIGWRIAGMALRPTAEIAAQAEAITEGTLASQITAHADVEEFTRLVQVLNAMLARLERAFRGQRQFTADASHELRGPLTALRGDIDLALKRDRPAAEYRATLERCREEVARLSRLTSDLLTLARSEAGVSADERVEVDLRALAGRVVERYRPMAVERDIRLAVTGDAAPVEGEPGLLERVVGNLVDNAIKHSPRAGKVEIELSGGDIVSLTVRDSGPGIPPEDVPHLFRRFFRRAAGRDAREGSGLGLAIARAAAEAHGGRLEFAGNEPGAVFRLTLPRSAAHAAAPGRPEQPEGGQPTAVR